MEAEVLALKWNNHQSIFYHIICGLRSKSNYTDVTLACEGKFYPVHKLVLSTCSEYFSDIFDRTPCKNPVVVLKDIQCKDLEFLLDYMYIGEVNVRQNELSSLIKAAECLKVKGLAVRDDDIPQPSNSKPRFVEAVEQEQTTPPAKRHKSGEHKTPNKTSILPATEHCQEKFSDVPQLEESNLSTDSSIAAHASDLHHHQADQSFPSSVGDEGLVEESENEPHMNSSLSEIKIEQVHSYEDENSFRSNHASLPEPYESEQYASEGGTTIPKVKNEEDKEVTEEGVIGVNFNDLLQSSLAGGGEGVDPHSSIQSQVDVDQPWDGSAITRALASHSLPSTMATHSPGSHHQQQQQQKAAAAALGLIHSTATESQSSLHLLQQQHGEGGTVGELFSQQQNAMVSEGGLIPNEFLWKKDKPQIRDYVCQFCGREFGHRTNLQAHLRIHTGEKPFRCLYCPYRTALKGNLKMHTISRHKIDWKAIKHLVKPFADLSNS